MLHCRPSGLLRGTGKLRKRQGQNYLPCSELLSACFGTKSILKWYSVPGCRKESCEESCVACVAHSLCKNHICPLPHTHYRVPCPFRLGYGTEVEVLHPWSREII